MSYGQLGHFAEAGQSTFTSAAKDTTGANLIVVLVWGTGSIVLTDNKSNTWVPSTEYGTSVVTRFEYAATPTVGSGHTFTLTGSNFYGGMAVGWWSGAHATPFDVINGANGSYTNTAQPGSITPGFNDELILSGFTWYSATTITSVTGMTVLDQIDFSSGLNYGGGLAALIQTTAAAINPTWNWTGSSDGAVAVAGFKAAAGGGNPQIPFLRL